jgi:hypothetical protein
MKPGPRHEIQALRKDGAVQHYGFSNEVQLKKIFEYLSGFYFGSDYPAQDKEELELNDAKRGF